jgi:predicted RNA-binding protein YlqC (UPF0109 family)
MADGELTMEDMRSWIEGTVRFLVDSPDKARVTAVAVPDDDMSIYTIYTAPDDIGKIIGREGGTVEGIRKVAGAISWGKMRRRCQISVNDPNRGERVRNGDRDRKDRGDRREGRPKR